MACRNLEVQLEEAVALAESNARQRRELEGKLHAMVVRLEALQVTRSDPTLQPGPTVDPRSASFVPASKARIRPNVASRQTARRGF